MKQDLEEAKQTVAKRIEYITAEMYGVDKCHCCSVHLKQ